MLKNIRIKVFLTLCLCALVMNLYAQDATTGATENVSKKVKKSTEQKWLEAVMKGDVKAALKAVESIELNINKVTSVSKKYEYIAKKDGIAPVFFSEPFNKLDFKLWYDAYFLKNKLKEFGVFKLKDKNSQLERIFEKVIERVKPLEKEKALIPWPTGIWVRQFGLCDRQSWLLSELAYQAGFDVQVVYLINPKDGVSPHTICEVLIQDDNGNVTWSVADPFSKVLLKGKSVADLAADKELMKKIWPEKKTEHKEWWKALPNSIFWTPSYPQDYCIKNQMLYKKLSAKLGSACPRFGEDPKKRMLRYKKLTNGNKGFKMGLWHYPFRVLKRELEVNH